MVEDSVKISNDKIELEPLNKEIIQRYQKTSDFRLVSYFLGF